MTIRRHGPKHEGSSLPAHTIVSAGQNLAPIGPGGPCERASRLLARGRNQEALDLLQDAAQTHPLDWTLHEALGRACFQDGQLESSESAFSRCIQLNPSRPHPHLGIADVFSARGQRAEAEKALREAIRIAPGFAQAWLRLAHLRRFRKKSDPDLRKLRTLSRTPGLPPMDAEAFHFALGKAYNDLECPQDAFRHMRTANELHKKQHPFEMNAMQQLVKRIISVCNADFFSRCNGFGHESTLPVFIVGMPRSGSSLVEQIISSHPRAWGVGELAKLPRMAADLPSVLGTKTPFPECLGELNEEHAGLLAKDYLRRLSRDAPEGVLRICDKMLSNLLLLGIVAVLFPKARVIHCRRNLMDLGLSMYQQSFSGGGVGYAYDLEDIGRYHLLSKEIIAHWKQVLPLSVFDVQYETLVNQAENETRQLLEAVELEWDPSCLEFHRGKSNVRTLSNWQVRQPIHSRSVERWRQYGKQLAPLRKYAD